MDKKLLQKFKAGKCTPEEIRKILLWYQSEESKASYSVEIDNLWEEEKNIPFPDKEELFDLIKKEIDRIEDRDNINDNFFKQRPNVQNNKVNSTYWLKIAAVIALLLLSFSSIFFFKIDLFEKTPVVSEVKMMTKEISLGQKYTLMLSDGTVIKMNSGSKIRYPEQFSDSARVIEFEGEAFFDIAKDHSRPFTIKSGNINTTVLGTSFNLKATAETEKFEVAVISGSVKVSHVQEGYNQEERYLTPNQSAVFDNVNNTFTVQDFDQGKVLAWVNGEIVFENSSLHEIVQTLEEWYGVDIDTSRLDKNISKGYTGSYKDKSLESVLDGISYVLDFDYTIEGKKVIIK